MATTHTRWWQNTPPEEKQGETQVVEGDGSVVAYWALTAFAFILLISPQSFIPSLAPLRIALLSAAVAIFAHITNRLKLTKPLLRANPALTAIFLLVLWAVITTPFSRWPGGSISFLMDLYLKTIIIFAMLTQVVDSVQKLKGLVTALVLISVPLAATTVQNFMNGAYVVDGIRVAGYAANLTENPNDMALMLNLILPLCAALISDAERITHKILFSVIAALIVAGVISTFSRAGFLTLLIIGLCYARSVLRGRARGWLPVVFLIAMTGTLMLPGSYVERVGTIVSIEEDSTGSAQVRLRDMKVAVQQGITHPLVGSGLGMNQLVMNDLRGETWTEIHNVYLQLLVDLGLPGLTLFLMLYWHAYRATYIAPQHGLGARQRPSVECLSHMKGGIRISLIAFGVAALFHPVAYQFYFYIIAGLAVAAGQLTPSQNKGDFDAAYRTS